MPVALYAISYRSTASVVALCSLEKQDPSDQPAMDRLLAALVGSRLPLSLFTSGAPIEIPADKLACDPVRPLSQQELEVALAEPYRYQVADPQGTAAPKLGDGQEKILKPATQYSISSITFRTTSGQGAGIKVTLSSPLSPLTERAEPSLWFDGRGLALREASALEPTSTATPIFSRDLSFALSSDIVLTPGASYGLVFFLAGAPVVARTVRYPAAGSGPPAPGPAAAAAFAGASASASGTASVPSRGSS